MSLIWWRDLSVFVPERGCSVKQSVSVLPMKCCVVMIDDAVV